MPYNIYGVVVWPNVIAGNRPDPGLGISGRSAKSEAATGSGFGSHAG